MLGFGACAVEVPGPAGWCGVVVVVVAESSSCARGCGCFAYRFGNVVDWLQWRPRFGSDMSDAGWVVVRDLLPVPGWLSGCGGCPGGCCHRRVIGAVRCLVGDGIKWWAVPAGFPLWPRVCVFFARWRDTGLVTELYGRLGEAVRVGEGCGAGLCAGGRGLAVGEGARHRRLGLAGFRRG
ncbi:transposase [Streptomyces misionensis]|uniref:transposase n=1 Tax=Streptomyces misionensis TaxID=67331 RepID=UPI003BB0800D